MKNPIHTVVDEIEKGRHILDQRGLLHKLRDEDWLVLAGRDAHCAIWRDADDSIRATLVRGEPLKVYGVQVMCSADLADDEIAVCHVLRRGKVAA